MLYENFPDGSIPYAVRITDIVSLPLHRHYEAELICCLYGKITANINGEEVFLSPGDTVLAGSLTPHSYEARGNAGAVLAKLSYGLLQEDFLSLSSLGAFYRVYTEASSVSVKMKGIAEILKNPEAFDRLELMGQLYSLSAELLRGLNAEDSSGKSAEFERIAPALRLVQTNYTDNLTIEDACRETGLAPGNFCTLFKNAVGTGFHAYLNHKRAETAALLLRQTDLPVREVAELSGFSDIKTFYRVFGRETGMSPLNFRKN